MSSVLSLRIVVAVAALAAGMIWRGPAPGVGLTGLLVGAGFGVAPAAAVEADLRKPLFTQSPRRARQAAPGERRGYRRAPTSVHQAPPPQRGFFETLFGVAPQPAPNLRTAPERRRQTAPSELRRSPSRAPARPPVMLPPVAMPKVDPSSFVVVFGPALGEGLDAAFAEKPDVAIETRPVGAGASLAELREALNARFAADGRISVAVVMTPSSFAAIEPAEATVMAMEAVRRAASRKARLVWVGLPPVADREAAANIARLNGALRAAVTGAGGVFVDPWPMFQDEGGAYSAWGPDVNGERVRLRGEDGVTLTRAGARKLAHFVANDIRRIQEALAEERTAAATAPVAIDPAALIGPPIPAPPVVRPVIGPVTPLNAPDGAPDGRLIAAGDHPALPDPVTHSALRDGVASPSPAGRADDFRWPRVASP